MPPGRTLRQQLQQLGNSEHGPKFSGDLLDYHYALTYGNAPQDRKRERQLAKAIKAWK